MKIIKPKFWDYKRPNYLSYILLPLTIFIFLSNFFRKLKKKNIKNKEIKTICLGNIYIGGTGKTPLTITINKILKNLNFKVSTIKKYYKIQHDEQKLLNNKTKLYCSDNRSKSLDKAINDKMDIAIFDDGLQDGSLNYDLTFVCFNKMKLIGNGFLIPAGPLRENIKSISKYDVVFLNGNDEDVTDFKNLIKKYNSNIRIFETYYHPINIDKFDKSKKFLIFSGIGNPENFKKTLAKNNFNIVKEIIFPDHYQYTKKDINEIKLLANNLNANILTTEKDYAKIDDGSSNEIDYLEIELQIKEENQFINFLKANI